MSHWVSFIEGKPGCVEFPADLPRGKRLDFIRSLPGCENREVAQIQPLPYPANPRLNKISHVSTDGRDIGPCPSFCYRPNECAGKSSCPRDPSCVD